MLLTDAGLQRGVAEGQSWVLVAGPGEFHEDNGAGRRASGQVVAWRQTTPEAGGQKCWRHFLAVSVNRDGTSDVLRSMQPHQGFPRGSRAADVMSMGGSRQCARPGAGVTIDWDWLQVGCPHSRRPPVHESDSPAKETR